MLAKPKNAWEQLATVPAVGVSINFPKNGKRSSKAEGKLMVPLLKESAEPKKNQQITGEAWSFLPPECC